MARASRLPDVQVCLAFTPAESEELLRAFLPGSLLYFPQRGNSLGEREANVFVDLLQRGFSRVVLIGGDIPTLPFFHLQEAFSRLTDPRTDVVLGPSEDGGYYLIGARKLHPCLFEDIAWSTATVLVETLAQARRHGLNVAQVPVWYDVDSEVDLARLAVELHNQSARRNAPATGAFLEQLLLRVE